jgi:hypothetical protein
MGVATSMVLGGIALAGVATSAAGQAKQGKQAEKAMQYNAAVSEIEAQNAENAAELEAFKMGRAKERMGGTQRATYAKAGVTQSGTPLSVQLESASEAEMDIMIMRWNGKVAKSRAKSQAQYERILGANYASAGKAQAASTLLQGVTSVGLQTFGAGGKTQ